MDKVDDCVLNENVVFTFKLFKVPIKKINKPQFQTEALDIEHLLPIIL